MYDNIGKKIKGLANATFIVEAILSVITGIALWVTIEEWWCALILFCGLAVAWVSSCFLYGFGEIIDKLCDIEQNTRVGQSKIKIKANAEITAKEEFERKQKIESVLKGVDKRAATKRCPHCGDSISSSICDMCGKSNNLFN